MMNKKDLKFYEAPACEVVEMELEGQLLAGSTQASTDPNTSTETLIDGGEMD